MKKFIILLYFIGIKTLLIIGQNQNSGNVSGTIIENSTKRPIEFANVNIHEKNNDSIIQGTVSDIKGKFEFGKIADGEYYLSYSFLGYAKKNTESFTIGQQNKNYDASELLIEPTANEIKEVEITGEKSTFTNSIDRKVFNVGKDLLSTTGSVSDLMQNIPSLQVDIEGNVSLRGSENVMVLINGKPSSLMGANRAAVLQQLPANMIERIEVITNPSAKYKPDGTSGIINIVMKKNKSLGLNGSITANAGIDNRYNASIITNYNPGKINFFANYSFRHDYRYRYSTDFRQRKDSFSNVLSKTDQILTDHSQPFSHIARVGFDYNINENNSLGISGNYNYRNFVRNELNSYKIYDGNDSITDQYERNRIDPEYEQDIELNATFQHIFSEEHELNIELNKSRSNEEEDNHYSTDYTIPVQPAGFYNTLIKQNEDETQFYLEYKKPISENTKLEAGYVFESRNSDLNFYGETFNSADNAWMQDIGISNHFKYNENIHALYSSVEHEIGKFGFLAGLRAEQAYVKSELITNNTAIHTEYFKVYPTLHMAYNLSEKNEIQLNYSHRINRPEGDELNPFPEYQDPYNLREGNPYLKPEDIHSVELGYQYKQSNTTFLTTIYDRYTYNGITEIKRYINDSVLLTTRENLTISNSAGLEVVMSSTIAKVISFNLSSNIFYNQIDASNLGYTEKKSNIVWTLNLNANVNFTKSTMFQINSNYSSEKLTPQGKQLPTFVVNMGLRQDLWKKKAAIIITVSDVFNTLRYRSELDTPFLYDKLMRKRSPRIIYAGFTYNFGKKNKKQKDEQIKFDNQL